MMMQCHATVTDLLSSSFNCETVILAMMSPSPGLRALEDVWVRDPPPTGVVLGAPLSLALAWVAPLPPLALPVAHPRAPAT